MLFLNPASDATFRVFVERALGVHDDPSRLQQRLRERYPRAVVRSRDLSGETVVVWYVYRDGFWVSS